MASTKFNVALLGSVPAAAMMAAGPVLADEVSDLKAQIEALSQKVQKIETQKAQPAVIPANVVTGGDFPGSFKLPGSNTSFKFGGYVKLDAIYDFDQKAGDQSGAVVVDSGTNAQDQDTGHFQMSARQTRLSFDSRTANEDVGTVRAYAEFDLNGSVGSETVSNSHLLRIRQAYVTMGPWLFGQAWGTFINLGAFVESIDFGGPVGGLLIRQAMVRYTQKFGATQLQLAIENPQNQIAGGTASSGERDRLPDFVFRISNGGDWGHISLAGVAEYITAETGESGGGTDDNALGYAFSLGGKVNAWGKDNLKWQVTALDGSPRYLLENINNGSTNRYDTTSNKIDTVKSVGGYLGYQHHWNPKWRSNLIVGGFRTHNPGQTANTVVENSESIHANVIYNATSKTNIGLEYQMKSITVENGDSGTMSRLQFMVQHSF